MRSSFLKMGDENFCPSSVYVFIMENRQIMKYKCPAYKIKV